jgi:DnaJ-class molecular chaperone
MKMNYYEVLTITKDAPISVIKAVYEAMIEKYSPDHYDGDKKIQAEKAIKHIHDAYKVLSDPDKRKNYDSNIHS